MVLVVLLEVVQAGGNGRRVRSLELLKRGGSLVDCREVNLVDYRYFVVLDRREQLSQHWNVALLDELPNVNILQISRGIGTSAVSLVSRLCCFLRIVTS
jgi:hypothetical protein